MEAGIVAPGQRLLEFGAGNLRNALYVLRRLPDVKYNVVEMVEVVNRFQSNYEEFGHLGGHLLQNTLGGETFDVVVCTFVLETICPSSRRLHVLRSLSGALNSGGIFIASVRGYPGVRGSRYERCLAGEGFITPLKTFIKPFSISELKELVGKARFRDCETLQKYRVDSPENIHITARLGGRR